MSIPKEGLAGLASANPSLGMTKTKTIRPVLRDVAQSAQKRLPDSNIKTCFCVTQRILAENRLHDNNL